MYYKSEYEGCRFNLTGYFRPVLMIVYPLCTHNSLATRKKSAITKKKINFPTDIPNYLYAYNITATWKNLIIYDEGSIPTKAVLVMSTKT